MASDSEQFDDAHGFFQFAALPDSEDDGIFSATRNRKADFDVTKINYTPKIDEDAWYDCSSELDVEDWLTQHAGLDEITFTAQRLYFTKNYQKASTLCKQTVLGFVSMKQKNLRVANMREILEIGAKSAIRIDDLEAIRFFYDWYLRCGGKNPGYNYFRAEVLTSLGQFDNTLSQYVEYLQERRQDATVWELTGKTLIALYQNQRNCNLWLYLALRAFCRSHNIICDCKNWKSMPISAQRKLKQEQNLAASARSALQLLAIDFKDLEDGFRGCESFWELCNKESALGESSLTLFLETCSSETLKVSVEWIFAQLANKNEEGQFAADDTDDENNVEEL
ncbi:hypothetical protein BX070DRAFT_229092 [Coemansia spiralis]|nr:hypothetical protein BX070DRAFT_229092 [Coemansia spiralis]